jgi:hypothetical protein
LAVGGLVLPPLELAAGAAEVVAISLKVVKYSCILLTGSDMELGLSAISDLFGLTVKRSGYLEKAVQKDYKPINEIIYSAAMLIDSFQKKEPTDSKEDLLPQFRKWLAKKYPSIPFDLCDKPATTPVTPPPTVTPPTTPSTPFLKIEVKPSAIPYQGTGNLNVKYSNPDNNSKNIEISGSGRKGILNPTFLIPEDKKGQGEFNFTLTNIGTELGGQGSASLDNFLDVTIGTGGGGQLFDTVNYRQQSFDLLAAPNGVDNILPNVYTVSSLDGLTRR